MLQCDVRDIRAELRGLEQRLARYYCDFAELVNQSPCLALSYLERIAHDRARLLHLTLLAHGLGTDYERWVQASMDERMCQMGFCRISRRRLLYVRRAATGLELSDIFATIQLDVSDLNGIMTSIRQ
ncbi:hypothetical protein [Chloroflexus sp.]|uniref:hypothetical protein n=1 Tax=Chloroflexus sp. TaxID=1904827 RepID=UPI00298F011F|nr:hypothetical protein [Chloroflexus sp.]MCS6888828.1 hypothetical protein [Chloroflexus sp.]MDW8402966.1 hypothetical protein [Chloroflexus sp.]